MDNQTQSVPLFTVAIEGPDGAGKSSLIHNLKQWFDIIEPPKSSAFKLMPESLTERIHWFRTEDPLISARIYMQAHGMRFRIAEEYATRKHHRMAQVNRFSPPPVLIYDRGPLSMEAYVLSCLKEDTKLTDSVLLAYIERQKQALCFRPPMMTLLLTSNREDAAALLASRLAVVPIDAGREQRLIAHQLQHFNKLREDRENDNFFSLDPFANQEETYKWVKFQIEEKLASFAAKNLRSLKEHSNISNGKIYLLEILQKLCDFHFAGRVYLVGGIVEKGYSDNDADFLVEKEEDVMLLKQIFGQESHYFHIELAANLDVDLLEGKNLWNLQVLSATEL